MDEQRIQRGRTFVVILVAALIGILLVSFGPASTTTADLAATDRLTTFTEPDATTTTTAPGAIGATTTTVPATTTAPTSDPGALPQTDEKPTASTATFTAGVNGLWEAIRQDKAELGVPFFFPESAYLQVKAINDPATDYQQRLIANYEEDIHTLHAQLGANASSAQLTGIDVPNDQAVLVQPGEESNKLSYWRVYDTTMRYTVDGQAGSFPVTSLISWRGEWYVVHLGAIR